MSKVTNVRNARTANVMRQAQRQLTKRTRIRAKRDVEVANTRAAAIKSIGSAFAQNVRGAAAPIATVKAGDYLTAQNQLIQASAPEKGSYTEEDISNGNSSTNSKSDKSGYGDRRIG